MGVFYTVAMKVSGQVKPSERGQVAEKEIELICAKYGLEVLKNESGYCSNGFEE